MACEKMKESAGYKLDDFEFDALLEEKFVREDVELGKIKVHLLIHLIFDLILILIITWSSSHSPSRCICQHNRRF